MDRLLIVDSRTFPRQELEWREALLKACKANGFSLQVGEVPSRGRLVSPDIIGIAGLAASVVGVALGLIGLFQRPKPHQTTSVLRSEITAVFEKHEQNARRIVGINGFDSVAANGVRSCEIVIEENQRNQRVHVVMTENVIVVSLSEIDTRLY